MDFQLSEEQKLVRETFERFCEERIKPQAAALDEAHEFPRDLFRELGELGLFGLRYPESLGGTNLNFVSYCMAITEVARGSMSLAAAATMQSLMSTDFLYRYGNES
ncbi:MAG: acyl-CoA dehydrogenase family protein, partial [Planctomycetes bacterium]|nr:acyl-CoA dehydrogenase family protein [Planctomycetota bacterium]